MKFNFKLFFAGLVLPVGFTSFFALGVGASDLPAESLAIHPYVVEIYSAKGEELSEYKGTSDSSNVLEISKSLGATVYTEDKISSFPDVKMGIGSKITVIQAPKYTVIDAKKKFEYRSWVGSVGELLIEQKIELGIDDKINFSKETVLLPNMEIKITRVAKTTIIEPEVIKFTTTKKNNPNLEKGTKNVLQAGKNGKKDKYYLVTREDGVEKSRKLIKTEIVSDPIGEILEIGTKVVVLDSGKATWYVKTSSMIAASNTIPKGTKVHIVNLNNGKSVDCTISGGGIYHDDNVVVDLSTAAFQALGATLGTGKLTNIRVEKYYPE